MVPDSPVPDESAIERWNQLHEALASQARRMVFYSLKDVPDERRIPLPEAAMSPDSSWGPEKMSIHLKHIHLPQLADAGYVRWSQDPFCVQRGPYFNEVEALFQLIHDSIGHFPDSLINGCQIYQELYEDAVQ